VRKIYPINLQSINPVNRLLVAKFHDQLINENGCD